MNFIDINKKIIALVLLILPVLGFASDDGYGYAPHLDGSITNLNIFWVIPFVGILLSIAIFPLFFPDFWHHHFGKVSFFWAVLFVVPFLVKEGLSVTLYELLHVGLLEYVPFIILLLALFTISGGVSLTGSIVGKPIVNVIIIFIGTVLASWMGTTGAAMLLIRPLIRANRDRKHKVHVIVFFIFLVANIGGSLTPLGDPPLFLGFLKGVDFFWTTKAMFLPFLFMALSLLVIFFVLDTIYYKKEKIPESSNEPDHRIRLEGSFNLILIVGVIGSVLLSGFWDPHISFTIHYIDVELQNIVRDIMLLSMTYASWYLTPKIIRENTNVVLTSKNSKVAEFDNFGNLIIKKSGKTTITAKIDDLEESLVVSAKKNPARKIKLDISENEIRTGDVIKLNAMVLDGGNKVLDNIPITYSYSGKAIHQTDNFINNQFWIII